MTTEGATPAIRARAQSQLAELDKPKVKGAAGKHHFAHVKRGKRPDLGGISFDSAAEANYARYLNWLKARGEVKEWQRSPGPFYFTERTILSGGKPKTLPTVKRGRTNYTPDFKVTWSDDRVEFVEVKGYMDDRSATAISRFRRYYPEHVHVLVDWAEYKALERQVSRLIPEWED